MDDCIYTDLTLIKTCNIAMKDGNKTTTTTEKSVTLCCFVHALNVHTFQSEQNLTQLIF